MLEDPSLEKEIIDGLILSLEVPKPTEAVDPKDIFYPSHIIGIFIRKMLDNGLLTRVQNITAKIIQSIQNVVLVSIYLSINIKVLINNLLIHLLIHMLIYLIKYISNICNNNNLYNFKIQLKK